MKVTLVVLNYAPSRGGAQEHIRRLAEGLVARGHDVTVLTTDGLRSPAAEDPGRIGIPHEVIAGVDVHRFGTPRPIVRLQRLARFALIRVRRRRGTQATAPTSPWLVGPWSPAMVRAVRRAVRTSDVVVGTSAPFATVLLPVLLRGRRDRAAVAAMPLLHLTGVDPHPAVLRALRRCDLVFASTEFEAAADRGYGVASAAIAVVPPGVAGQEYESVDPAEARRRTGLPERPTVGFIGRLAAYKGVDTMLAAAPLLWAEHPDTTVLVAGSPVGWTGFRTAIPPEEHKERLVIREGFADGERSLLLAACDVVVHPSSEESFGLIALEAWAARRPVVLGDIGAVRSFVREGETAELVGPTDAPALAAVLGRLLDDPGHRQHLAEAGHAEIVERYDWEHICDAWADALARATDRSR